MSNGKLLNLQPKDQGASILQAVAIALQEHEYKLDVLHDRLGHMSNLLLAVAGKLMNGEEITIPVEAIAFNGNKDENGNTVSYTLRLATKEELDMASKPVAPEVRGKGN